MQSVLDEYNEQWIKDGSIPHVSLTKEGVVAKTKRYDRDSLVTNENKKYRITHLNDICYNPANLKFGVICRNTFGTGIFSPIYVTFKVNTAENAEFVEHYLCREQFIRDALRSQEGTVYERMSVKPMDLLSRYILMPKLGEQKSIGGIFTALDSLITLHQRSNQPHGKIHLH